MRQGQDTQRVLLIPKILKINWKRLLRSGALLLWKFPVCVLSYAYKKLSEFKGVLYDKIELYNEREQTDYKYDETDSLFDERDVLMPAFESKIEGKVGVIIAGSAGGGVQSAAKLLANAGIMSGLYATMKGEYPITVGTGFSAAEVIFSTAHIHYTGLEAPDYIIMVTKDGFTKVNGRIKPQTRVIADQTLKPDFEKPADFQPLLKEGGKKEQP
jgi:hypothetical protein